MQWVQKVLGCHLKKKKQKCCGWGGKREPEKLGSVVAPGSICASWWDPALFVGVQPGEATFSPDALSCL